MSLWGAPQDRQPSAQECLQYFAQLALGLTSSASGASQPEVEPKPVEPARGPAPPACEKKEVTKLGYYSFLLSGIPIYKMETSNPSGSNRVQKHV